MKYFSYYAERLKFSYMSKLVLSSFFAAVMLAFILLTGSSLRLYDTNLFVVAVFFALLYFAGMAIFFYGKSTEKVETIFVFAALLAAVLYIRSALMYYASADYNTFLREWIAQLTGYKGLDGLKVTIGDYTMPYRYFLLILSKIGGNHVTQIKMFSLCFDLLGAYYIMKIVELKSKSTAFRIFAFILPLLAPTAFLNSAMWGQCDMIYVAFCLGGIYYALKGKGRAAVIMAAIGFCFKLQTIFFAPVFLILFFIGKIRWRDLLWFPAVVLISITPAVLAGASPIAALSPYLIQVQEYRHLSLNLPSVWVLVTGEGEIPFDNFNKIGIMLAGAAAVSLVYIAYKYRHKLDLRRIINITFISVLIIPFLLPRMHDRYFFAADMMSLVYFFYNKKRWYVPLVVLLSSYIPYSRFLYSGPKFVPYTILALMLIGVLASTLYELVDELMNGPAPKKPLCSKEDCRVAKRILVREAALSGCSVIEGTCEDKISLSTDIDLAEVELDEVYTESTQPETETETDTETQLDEPQPHGVESDGTQPDGSETADTDDNDAQSADVEADGTEKG